MKKTYLYKQWWFWSTIAVLLIASAVLIIYADALSPNSATMWAGIVSAGSTALLGCIAVWQNIRQQNDNAENQSVLLKMEENNFIANFSSMVLLNRISFDFPSGRQVNYDLHTEQLLQSENDADDMFGSPAVVIAFVMKYVNNNIPTLVKISTISMFTDPENIKSTVIYHAVNFRDGFSSIAIKNNEILFPAKILMKSEKINALKSQIDKTDNKLFLQARLTFVSAEAVATECTCQSYLITGDWNKSQDFYSNYCTSEDYQPMTFIDKRYIIKDQVSKLNLIVSEE